MPGARLRRGHCVAGKAAGETHAFKMAPAGDPWRELVLTFHRRGGTVDVDTAVRWAPSPGLSPPPPAPAEAARAEEPPHKAIVETFRTGMATLGRGWDRAYARPQMAVGHVQFKSVYTHAGVVRVIDWRSLEQVLMT